MATVWLTYAWKDNEHGDVDYIAQELTAAGIVVKLDRWNIHAGKRLWEQIADFIQNPGESDAWVLFATQNSLGSEPCKEEYAYALDRALRTRGGAFPVIGLFPGPVSQDLIPAGIRSRLYISITDPDWKERLKAAAEGQAPTVARPQVEPYFAKIHYLPPGGSRKYMIELRPRAGTWSPFAVSIPIGEKDKVNPFLAHGPAGGPPGAHILYNVQEGASRNGEGWVCGAANEATPTQSYYVYCDELLSKMLFGVPKGVIHEVEVKMGRSFLGRIFKI